VATGQPIDPSEVAAEAIGEIFGAPGEAVGTYRAQPKPIGVAPPAVPVTTPIAQPTAAPVEQAQRVPPASEFQDTAALMAELQGKPLEKVAMPVAEAVAPEVKPTTLENIERPQIQTPQFPQTLCCYYLKFPILFIFVPLLICQA
jgi:hypothetical protein